MEKTLYIVRHGQDEDNKAHILNGHRDTRLTVLGEKQAERAAEKLQSSGIDLILSSPLKRAFQTAQIIAKQLNVSEVLVSARLIEREYGVLTGVPAKKKGKLAKELRTVGNATYFLGVEGAEEFPTLLSRAQELLKTVTKKYPKKTILFVTHGDFIQMIRAAYFGWSWEKGLEGYYLKNGDAIVLSTEKEKLL